MTGLHALHMIIGMGLMVWMLLWAYNGTLRRRLLLACRDRRAVLALRRYRLDFPLPAALPDRAARDGSLTMAEHADHHVVPRKVYYVIFGTLHGADGCHRAVAYVDLGPMNVVVAIVIACVQGADRGALLHAREVQHAARETDGDRRALLDGHSAGAHVERLPHARLGHLRAASSEKSRLQSLKSRAKVQSPKAKSPRVWESELRGGRAAESVAQPLVKRR